MGSLTIELPCSHQPLCLGPSQTVLVGGFNAFQKYYSNWIISPARGENTKRLKPPSIVQYCCSHEVFFPSKPLEFFLGAPGRTRRCHVSTVASIDLLYRQMRCQTNDSLMSWEHNKQKLCNCWNHIMKQ